MPRKKSTVIPARQNQRGFTLDEAWRVAMGPEGSQSVVNLEIGGYAVPVSRAKKIAPPSKVKPIRARLPSGVVSLLPGAFGGWRIVGSKGQALGRSSLRPSRS